MGGSIRMDTGKNHKWKNPGSHIHAKKDMWAEQVFVMTHFNY